MKISTSKTLLLFIIVLSLSMASFAQSSRVKKSNVVERNDNKALKILVQPMPKLTDEQKEQLKILKKDVVRINVEFLDIGLTGAVTPVDSLPESLFEAFSKAAQEIKFEPEIKAGIRRNVTKVVEYSFKAKSIDDIKVSPENAKKAEAIIKRAVEKLGGEKYLQVRTQIGEGKFSVLRDGRNALFQSFVDIIVYPNKERTDFKTRGSKSIQTNYGDQGWLFDETLETLDVQTEAQVENFKRGMRTNMDNFLRGVWRGKAVLDYVGRRSASVGVSNEVLKLTYSDGFEVEFEFSDEGFPMKTVYTRMNNKGQDIKEEDRFAQYITIQGIETPFIIDHFSNGKRTSRVNYESVEYNKPVPEYIFDKPTNIKAAKKKLKF